MKQNKSPLLRSRRILYIIASLIMALALWVYVRTNVNPYSDPWIYRIPVTFEGEEVLTEDRSLMLLSGHDATIDLHLYGKREDLTTLNRNNISVTADLRTIRGSGSYALDYEIAFPENITQNAVTILERTPSSVAVTVGQLMTKPVPVRGSGGTPAAGYMAETMICEPDQIMVSGPAELVKTISYAAVVLERDNLERTVNATLPYTLTDKDGNPVESTDLTCDVDQVEVELPIIATKVVKLTVELIDGGGATEEDTVCTIKPETITLSGDAETLKGVNQISLGTIDLAEVLGQATLTRHIALPNDTQNLTGEEEAEITVELKGLDSRTVRTTKIELINQPTPDKYDYTVVSAALSVVIRGRAAVVEQIYGSNLRAVADLSEYMEPGQYKVPVTIKIDGYSDVGILHEGEYEVAISITKKPEKPEKPIEPKPDDEPEQPGKPVITAEGDS